MHTGLDHLAIVVADTEAALKIWRDRFGFPVVVQEAVNNGTVLLTHLDLGNTHLQLVQPLVADHPLQSVLAEQGPGLHHFCLRVENIDDAIDDFSAAGIPVAAPTPHQGTVGKRAIFLDRAASDGIVVELTGA